MFSSLPETNFNSIVTFILSSANALNLDLSKILPFGTELTMLSEYRPKPQFMESNLDLSPNLQASRTVMHPGFPNYGAYAPLIWQKGGI